MKPEKLFAALADRTRLRILNLVSAGEVCVCYFVEILGESQPKISRHLATLREAGLVQARRDGKWIHYSLAPEPPAVLQTVIEELRAQAEFTADFSLPAATLKYLLGMVHFAMAQQDIRYYLNGMLLVVDGTTVRAVATDGHRLALAEVTKADASNKIEAIVPRKTILELSRLLPDSEDPVRVQMAANQAKFSFGDIELISKLVEGKFPDYQRVVPAANTKTFAINREDLMHALQRAAILTTDKFKGVRMLLGTGTLKINSTNADQEDAQEELEIGYEGDSLDIGFNVNYLLDVLANLKNDQVSFSLGDALGSALITMPNSDKFKYVVMPMRI